VSLSDLAYRRFKTMMFERRVEPGAVLSQQELCSLLDVPVTPLRDAIRSLQSEGLVEVLPRNGIRMLKPDLDLIRSTYQLRRILEREGVKRFVESSTDEELRALKTQHEALRDGVDPEADSETLRAFVAKLDEGFHATLIASLQNPFISSVYSMTKDRVTLIRVDKHYTLTLPMIRATLAEHEAVMDAIERRDVAAATNAMDQHMAMSMHRAMGM
jgi:DNA-binding GntR family transcriptional regulator